MPYKRLDIVLPDKKMMRPCKLSYISFSGRLMS